MTRINIVPVEELADQHLMAEYREIFMVGPALRRSLESKRGLIIQRDVPRYYTLNAGHVKFFYNKGLYLKRRYDQIVEELQRRNFNLDKDRVFPSEHFRYPLEYYTTEYYKDWKPSAVEMTVARERIALRIQQKPNFYRYYGKPYESTVCKTQSN